MSMQFLFKYDDDTTVEINFNNWYVLNCEERTAYNEALISREEAVKIFEEIFNKKVDF